MASPSRPPWEAPESSSEGHGRLVDCTNTHHGRKYVIDDNLVTPRGNLRRVRTVWMVEPGRQPRLVTAYPV